MADRNVDIELGIKSKTEGAEKAKKSLGGVLDAVMKVRGAIGKLMAAFGLIGLAISGITMMIDALKKLKDWYESSAKAARAAFEAARMAKFEQKLIDASLGAKLLSERLSDVAEKLAEINKFRDFDIATKRALTDASLNLNEQRELSGVTDPLERAKIQDKYALKRIDQTEQRAKDDVLRQKQDLEKGSSMAYDEAMEWRKKEKALDASISEAARAANNAKNPGLKKKFESVLDGLVNEAAEYAKKADAAMKRSDSLLEQSMKVVPGLTTAVSVQADADRKRIANAAADREREARRKAEEESERKKREAEADAERKRREDERNAEKKTAIQDKIDEANGEIGRLQRMSGSVGALQADDRISNLGGFATIGAATLTGVGFKTDKNPEITKLTIIVTKLLSQLEAINANTRDSSPKFA